MKIITMDSKNKIGWILKSLAAARGEFNMARGRFRETFWNAFLMAIRRFSYTRKLYAENECDDMVFFMGKW